MIGRLPAVFISCSDSYRESVAHPVRDALIDLGLRPVIVSEESRLSARAWDPEAKVESYLRSCEAFVALVTPDERLADGRFQCRPNIPDEVDRAQSDPRLRDHMIVVQAPDVDLWSNINPTYDRLDVNDVGPTIDAVVEQLRVWQLLPVHPSTPTSQLDVSEPAQEARGGHVTALMFGLGLGEDYEARRRVYRLFRQLPSSDHMGVVDELVRAANETIDQSDELVACSLLEAIDRIDPSLVGTRVIEDLASSSDYSLRSCAAVLLWQKAESAPHQVPVAILGRLAKPNGRGLVRPSPSESSGATTDAETRRRASDPGWSRGRSRR